jgi:hypothetical protein
MFFNSVLIVLISNFFVGPFVKVIFIFNFTFQSNIKFILYLLLILIFLIAIF